MAPLVMPVFPAVGLLKAHETGEIGRLLIGIVPLLQLILLLIVAARFHCAGHHGQHSDAYVQPGNETFFFKILQQSVEFSCVFLAEVGSKTSREITDFFSDVFSSLVHHADALVHIHANLLHEFPVGEVTDGAVLVEKVPADSVDGQTDGLGLAFYSLGGFKEF